MSEIGYYRYKVNNLTKGSRVITFFKSGALAGSKTVTIKPICTADRIIKYLDRKGQYRFYAFNKFWEQKDKAKELGRQNKLITSILTGQNSTESLGYSNERTIKLIADDVTQDELTMLADLWISPKVFLYIGSGDDEEKDWIDVTVTAKDATSKISKGNVMKLVIDVELPEYYTLRKI